MTSRGGRICFGSSATSCEQRTLRFEGLLRPGLASCVYGKRWAKRFLENCAPRLPISSRSICRARSPKTSIVGVDLERAIEQGPRFVDGVALFFWGLLEAADEHAPAVHPQIDDARRRRRGSARRRRKHSPCVRSPSETGVPAKVKALQAMKITIELTGVEREPCNGG
jgi:hypothetical protein